MKFLQLTKGFLLNTRYIKSIEITPVTGFLGSPVMNKANLPRMEANLIMDRDQRDFRFSDDTEEFRNIDRFVKQYNDKNGNDAQPMATTNNRWNTNNESEKTASSSQQPTVRIAPMQYTYSPTRK